MSNEGEAILAAIEHNQGDHAWQLIRQWATHDPTACTQWRNALTTALQLADLTEFLPHDKATT